MATKTTDQKQAKSSFLKGVRTEFKKIVWPSKKSVFYYSLAVVIISIISSVMIWGLDSVLKKLLGLIIR
ncbi:MAG: preprotein translocase subunit SecE [Peptoniphilaceae bacterium]|uniref:preprotein translocase subunit SecE n=1 Tax=Parvimonas sp. TaxID=1944660 RepID=UPI0025D7C602|nr:preprotein translocase subunit SecE [Parvimonas sp.]MCI5997255.1 preprotein translocase subunit SecE [Parvimonas sp.]MDD7764349.1 preprotein translocase subunit SecE [Peptoniphilaceae bacterium]MDY3050065.1 preprotein translocase subunit SecE [Parvimonas sp.]